MLECFKKYKTRVETEAGRKLKFFQTDNGREFYNNEFNDYLSQHGIQQRLSAPYSPQQNDVAERMNRALVEMGRCLLKQAKMPPIFWAEAINTACYIRNRCISKALNGDTPHMIWKQKKPNLTYFKTFVCKAFTLDKTVKGKFATRGRPCILVGYSQISNAYRL